MASTKTNIEWTDRTWNPTTGCNKVSPGCTHCYAEAITQRFTHNFPNGFQLTQHPERLKEPTKWRKPSRIFVNSMSDLFHEEIELAFLKDVFEVIRVTPWHIYQILTKRPQRMLELKNELTWHSNIWLGVSVENQDYTSRIDLLRDIPVQIRFLSCEPLLGALQLDLTDIHWVIVGGESGNKYRPIKPDWVTSIRDQCLASNVPFFFKQWGGRTPKAGGRLLEGKLWDEMPKIWEKHQKKWNKISLPSKRKIEQVTLFS